MNLFLSDAQATAEWAQAAASELGVPMNIAVDIAVVDGGAHLLAFALMDF